MEITKLSLQWLDYLIIILYFVMMIAVGFIMASKASKNMRSYFLSENKMSWWILGTSMVATTFSAGTPLLFTAFIREYGISKNWEWWPFLLGQMFTTFFFARLWQRTRVLNDAEFIQLRYSGKEASFLRAFRSLYMGGIMNVFVLGTDLFAAVLIGTTLLGIDSTDPNYEKWKWSIAVISALCVLIYTAVSGFGGVLITDCIQFGLGMLGCIFVAYFAMKQPAIKGFSGLIAQIHNIAPEKLNIFPFFGAQKTGTMTLMVALGYCAFRWWTQVYGGAEPGGQSYVVQRMVAAKNEKEALYATLWFNFSGYVIRNLPWVIAAFASIILLPIDKYTNHDKAYLALLNYLPIGFKGLMIAAFLATTMANFATRLNLGASYFVNDLYIPFFAPKKSQHHYIVLAKFVTITQVILSFGILLIVTKLETIFFIYAGIGSGAGLVYMLRFYWWRVSAWSEIAAMSSALVTLIAFRWGVYGSETEFNRHGFEYMFISAAIVTFVWLLATFLTKPTDMEKLKEFFIKVRPAGPFWKPISTELAKNGVRSSDNLKIAFIGWAFSNPMVLGYLFGSIYLIMGNYVSAVIWLFVGLLCTFGTVWSVKKLTIPETSCDKTSKYRPSTKQLS